MASSSTSSNRSTPLALTSALFDALLVEQCLFLIAETTGFFELLLFDRTLLGLLDLGELALDLLEIGRGAHALDAQTGAGFVDEVDCLVGQMTVADVAIREVGGGDDGLIGDRDPVMGLVLLAHALQDLDRHAQRRLFDAHRLEAALECGVLLEVLAVLVECRGADGLQFATGQHRLQDRCRVDRTLGCAGADERVDLVDEQHDVAAGLDLFQHLLEALLEIAAVTAACDEGAEIEGVQLLVAQRVGDVVADDLLSETFDDRGLADAGLADEHRIVLGAAAEDLHHALELAATADDRVELLLASELGEVATELVEDLAVALVAGRVFLALLTGGRGLRLALALRATLVAAEQLDDLLANSRQVCAELDEHLCGDAFAFANEAEENVFCADVVVPELQRLAKRQLEHLLGAGSERDVTRRRRATLADDLFDLIAHGLERDAQTLQCLCRDTFTFVDESEENVFGADVAVTQQPSFLLSQHHDPPCPIGEAFKHDGSVSAWRTRNVSPNTHVESCDLVRQS